MKKVTGYELSKLIILAILAILFICAGYQRMNGTEIATWISIFAGFFGILLATLELFHSKVHPFGAFVLFGVVIGSIIFIVFNSVSLEAEKKMWEHIKSISEGFGFFAISLTILPIIFRDLAKIYSYEAVASEKQNKLNKVRSELHNKKLSHKDIEEVMEKVNNL